MVRLVKEHEVRKNELLDVAQALFYQNGYESTSVANIIDSVGIAKGTFYHYFKSKIDLLDQIVERQIQKIDLEIEKVLDEIEENAIVELNNIFQNIGQYKLEHKQVMLLMVRVLYSEKNIILKTKMYKRRVEMVAPKIARVIKRGKDEGVFKTGNPDYIARMLLEMGNFLGEAFAEMLLNDELNEQNRKKYLEICKTYEQTIETILGAPNNSITIFDEDVINGFFN
jgi:AcrR family transcriptional regulator